MDDHKRLSSVNISPFKDRMEMVERLLPFHTVQMPIYPTIPNSSVDDEKLHERLKRVEKSLDLNDHNSKQVRFAFLKIES